MNIDRLHAALKTIIATLTCLCLAAPVFANDDNTRFEVTPFAAYRVGGTFEDAESEAELELAESNAWGFIVNGIIFISITIFVLTRIAVLATVNHVFLSILDAALSLQSFRSLVNGRGRRRRDRNCTLSSGTIPWSWSLLNARGRLNCTLSSCTIPWPCLW